AAQAQAPRVLRDLVTKGEVDVRLEVAVECAVCRAQAPHDARDVRVEARVVHPGVRWGIVDRPGAHDSHPPGSATTSSAAVLAARCRAPIARGASISRTEPPVTAEAAGPHVA